VTQIGSNGTPRNSRSPHTRSLDFSGACKLGETIRESPLQSDPKLVPRRPFLARMVLNGRSRLRVIELGEGNARNYRPSTDKSGCVPSMIDRPSANPACSAVSAFGRSGIA
jgi:hypothetical protein